MKQAVLVFAIALVITLAIGPAVINYLRKMKFGQKILEIGPKWHMNKQNIPTMGGFMFIIGIALAVILGGLITGTLSVHALAILGLSAAYGAVGLVDDYAKIKKKENAGLTPRQKLVLQILVAAVFILVLFLESDGLPSLMIPFTGISIDLPWPVYIIFAAFVIVGADNAVNLTDGIDGLAASVTVPVAVFFAAVGARIGKGSSLEAAQAAFAGIYPVLQERGIELAVQCCEHLNRALVVEREVAEKRGFEIVNAIPQLHAGGSFAMTAWANFKDPVLVETIVADAGIDIGGTLIGMHLRRVAIPVRLSIKKIGEANILCARTRPKYIGGARAVYQEL